MQHSDGSQQQPEGALLSTTPSSLAAISAIAVTHPTVSQLRVTGRVPVVTAATAAIGVVAAGQQGMLSTVAGVQPMTMSPQAVMVPTQTVSHLLSPATSVSANAVQISANLNVLQRQLSTPGVVGLSAVSAQDLQHVLQQASQQSITLLTATEAVGNSQQRPRLARPLSFSHSTPALPAVSSMSATGATIHHHGQSPVRGVTLSHSNLQHSLLGMNLNPQQQQQLSAQRRGATTAATTTTTTTTTSSAMAVMPAANIVAQSRTVLEVRAPSGQPPSLRTASGVPPRKKIRLEEKPPPNAEVASYRRQLVELKHKQMKELKSEYFENLTEMFFLQNGLNLIDYHTWKKRPTPQLVGFLTSGKLDSDDEDDVLQVKEINSEVKVLTNPGSNVPLATPVAISTTLPPLVSALSQQVVAPSAQQASAGTIASLTASSSQAIASSSTPSAGAASLSQLQQQLSRTQDSKSPSVKGQMPSLKQVKTPPMSPGQRLHTRQQSLSAVYDNLSGNSQEVIVERAKQEAQVVQRVAELRKEGLWSSKRLPRVQEPPRQKAHWDYLLEEMTWLAADFIQERKWKKAAARKVARMVFNYFKEQEQKELKAEKEEAVKLKKIASHMSKMVKEFWSNIEKVVQYKQQMRLDEKKKRALDLHLNFIMDQTEKYSSWLTESLQITSSINGSLSTSPSHSSDGGDFEPSENSTDDEETIQKEEDEAEGTEDHAEELEALMQEMDLPLEELLKTLPQEVLDTPAPLPPPLPDIDDDSFDRDDDDEGEEKKEDGSSKEEVEEKERRGKADSDHEFTGAEEEPVDVEDTIDEQEKYEKHDYNRELQDLAEEGELSLDELADKYAGAYDSDFEVPKESSSEEEDNSELDSDDYEVETESSSDEEEEEEELKAEFGEGEEDSPGLEELTQPQQLPTASPAPTLATATRPAGEAKKGDQEDEVINDIAAQALSLQPKGYTLETTEVKTKVPFLLKHKLREYQHVGLDWLATMHDKHLNGILADEMGLGKTIQTIALLAHLACEKGNWGPHLIVVPTSVMLNWEMELKKWCPSFKILTYYGNQKERKLKRQGWTKTNAFHVCITSYKLVVQDHQAFRRKKWKYLILDEAQNIKNFKSQRWQMLLNFSSQRRLLLTGTPLQNSLMELWSLMHFLMPNVFQSHRDFKEWFSNPLTGMIEGSQEYNENLIKRLHRVLRPFLLRRLKNEVEKQMPQKYEHVVMCRLSKRQRYLYDDFMSQAKTKETLATGHYMSVINILMQLRKVCNHPNLFDPRPVVSPFFMEKLYYTTASPVNTILVKDPLEEVDMHTLFPNLAEMERDLPAFVAHRVKQLRTSPMLIEEIDYQPEPPPPLPKGQLKAGTFSISAPLLQQSGRLSPVVQALSGSPVDLVKAAVTCSATPTALTVSRPAVSSQITATPTVPLSIPLAALASSSLLTSTTSASATTSLPAAALSVSTAATLSQVRSLSGQPTLLLTTPGRTAGSAALVVTSSAPALVATATMVGSTGVNAVSGLSATPLTSTLQAKVLSQPSQGTVPGGGSAVLSTQPITVQIQQTNQGTRLMIPTGQLSQLPASLFQIVQTSSGQHLVATSTPTSLSTQVSAVLPVTSTASSTVNGPSTLTTVASTGGQGLVTTAVSQLKTITALTTIASTTPAPSSTVSSSTALSALSSVVVSSTSAKAPLRVTSLVTSTLSGSATTISTIAATTSTSCTTTTTTTTTTSCTLPASLVSSVVSTLKSVMSPKKRSELFLDSVYEKRKRRRREKLKRVASVNTHHCTHTPVYGPDLIETLTLSSDLSSQCHRERYWLRAGFAHCQCVHTDHNGNLPKYFWHETRRLFNLVHTPQQYLDQLKDVLDRFTFCIPSVISPGIELRLAHQDSSLTQQDRRLACEVREHLRPVNTLLNNLRMRMTIHFPELRLIQYDCGKLQTMDVLLRQLKSGSHRVLIFTQMTKMLDVLEAFLNYHGHRYLRLDGTTRVEQRQALMERFNADRRIFCFILSTRSGGIGVNLTGADTVIFYDSDWNPTMDAQAQDRCHRIGQTRDVHIYRLISEATVEENILKKANQKRLLGDLAIEGGNFTTAFFKEQTIKDLFAQPTGLKSLTEEKETMEVKEMSAEDTMDVTEEEPATPSNSTGKKTGKDKDANIMAAFEQALCKAEDETDAMAASLVKAEQKAELDDFDESIPWDEKEAEAKKEEEEMSRAEQELAMLDKELSGIERYAVAMMERQMEDEVMEELKMAEEDIENSKKDWELTRLKALKEEEERRARMEEDEMLYTYLCDDAQVNRRLTKAGTIRKKPGRPRIRPLPSPSLSLSDTGSVDSKALPSRASNRVALKLTPERVGGKGRRKEEGEEEQVVVKETSSLSGMNKAKAVKTKVSSAIARKVSKGKVAPPVGNAAKAKVPTLSPGGDNVQNGPVKLPAKRVRKNNSIISKSLPNGDGSVEGKEEVRVDESGEEKKGVKVPKKSKKAPKGKLEEEVVKAGDAPKPARRGRPVGRPSKAAKAAAGLSPSRAILKVPAMVAGPVNTAPPSPVVPITAPLRNKSPGAGTGSPVVTSPVSSPGSVPPPWSNPNLVIRTRRANIHSPVQMASNKAGAVTSGGQGAGQAAGFVQRPVGVVHSGSLVRLVSPSGPIVALATSQPLQVVNAAGRVRPATITGQISLAGARVLGAGQIATAQVMSGAQQVISGTGVSLAGARVVTSQPPLVSLPGARLINATSLAGARVFRPQQLVSVAGTVSGAKVLTSSSPAQVVSGVGVGGARVLSTGGLQGSLVRMPDGSTAVLGQIAATSIMAAQVASTGPTLLVSPTTQQATGARAVLASSLAATARGTTTAAIRLTTPQVVGATGIRTVQLGTGRLTSPVALRGMGTVPLGVNIVKAGTSGVQIPLVGQAGGTGVSIPLMGGQGLALRGGQIIQTNLAQAAASPHSFVLITPRAATPTPTTTSIAAPGSISGSAEKKGTG